MTDGMDYEPGEVESGGRIHLVLYWSVRRVERIPTAALELDGEPLGSHEIGFGNLRSYQTEVGPVSNGVVRKELWMMIPSTTPAGEQALSM